MNIQDKVKAARGGGVKSKIQRNGKMFENVNGGLPRNAGYRHSIISSLLYLDSLPKFNLSKTSLSIRSV